MKYNIFFNEKKLSTNTNLAISEYIKRLSPYCNVNIQTSKKNPNYRSGGYNISLVTGQGSLKTISSEAFAEKINQMSMHGASSINIFIGYDDDLICDEYFSVSTLRLSDEILLIAFVEQLYRAYTINNNITYHK